jgi:hypothetical protein
VVEHFNAYWDKSVVFYVIFIDCIDGLDSCFVGEADDRGIRFPAVGSKDEQVLDAGLR